MPKKNKKNAAHGSPWTASSSTIVDAGARGAPPIREQPDQASGGGDKRARARACRACPGSEHPARAAAGAAGRVVVLASVVALAARRRRRRRRHPASCSSRWWHSSRRPRSSRPSPCRRRCRRCRPCRRLGAAGGARDLRRAVGRAAVAVRRRSCRRTLRRRLGRTRHRTPPPSTSSCTCRYRRWRGRRRTPLPHRGCRCRTTLSSRIVIPSIAELIAVRRLHDVRALPGDVELGPVGDRIGRV